MYASKHTDIRKWIFRPCGQFLDYVRVLVPVHVLEHSDRTIYICEKFGKSERIVKRSRCLWKVQGIKNKLACILGKKTPFDCYVDDTVRKWSEQRIRVSIKDRNYAQSIPFKQVSKLCVEIYIEDQTIEESRIAYMFQPKNYL